jgi:hypothetical protein
MMIAGIVRDHHNLSSGMATGLSQFLQEHEKSLCIEFIIFPPIHKLTVTKTDCAKVANTSVGWFMQ